MARTAVLASYVCDFILTANNISDNVMNGNRLLPDAWVVGAIGYHLYSSINSISINPLVCNMTWLSIARFHAFCFFIYLLNEQK